MQEIELQKHALDYWRESLEFDGDSPVPFEIELFFRSDETKRRNGVEAIRHEIQSLDWTHNSRMCNRGEIFLSWHVSWRCLEFLLRD